MKRNPLARSPLRLIQGGIPRQLMDQPAQRTVRFSHLGYESPKCRGIIPYEHQEQSMVREWAEIQSRSAHPEFFLLHAIPNGCGVHAATVMKMLAEGLKSGVPDLNLPVACRSYHGLWIEMKRRDVNVVDWNQYVWLTKLHGEGQFVEVCRSSEEAIRVLEWYVDVKSAAPYPLGILEFHPKDLSA